jgi:hydrogenase nickel incorporation protein HypA/HybF
MHELAVTESILRVALRYANEAKAEKIIRIHLRIGSLSDVSDEWLQRYFDFLSKDSIAEKAVLSIEHVPAMFRCEDCGESFPFDLRKMSNIECPACRGSKVTLISGREFFIKNIEVI